MDNQDLIRKTAWRYNRAEQCGLLWRQRLGVTGPVGPEEVAALFAQIPARRVVVCPHACPIAMIFWPHGKPPFLLLTREDRFRCVFGDVAALGSCLYAGEAWLPTRYSGDPTTSPEELHRAARQMVGEAFAEAFLLGKE